jgi:dienelactone hydrolase
MPNMIGRYGPWAAGSAAKWQRELSYLNPKWKDIEGWRKAARAKMSELLAGPMIGPEILASLRVRDRFSFDGLDMEELCWQLPYGPETGAIFLKPRGESGPLPGVLALHDHAGVKYFGKRKIMRTSSHVHPSVREHQELYYGGIAWANALARRGYGVLVHDVFPFESRRIRAAELPGHVVKRMMCPPDQVEELTPADVRAIRASEDYEVGEGEDAGRIAAYNSFAARHEEIVAKSLICAGFTWAGVFAAEDRAALELLCARPEIDGRRIGCCGLSLGGLRTDYLAGMDDRIRCSVTVGFMTTWRDLILNSCYTHTWMLYVPLLSRYMDFPEVLGMRAPLPSMVLATEEDPLFDFEEVKKAIGVLEKVYAKAGSPESFGWAVHPGPHQFDRAMQDRAFAWLDAHLKR